MVKGCDEREYIFIEHDVPFSIRAVGMKRCGFSYSCKFNWPLGRTVCRGDKGETFDK